MTNIYHPNFDQITLVTLLHSLKCRLNEQDEAYNTAVMVMGELSNNYWIASRQLDAIDRHNKNIREAMKNIIPELEKHIKR